MIYFITPAEGVFPGINRLFKETIKVVGGEHIFLNDLHKITKNDVAIFGAWSPIYSTAIRRCKAKKKIIHWASPLLQAELAGVEVDYLTMTLQLLEKNIIQGLWVIDADNYEVLKERKGVFHTPTPFSVERLKSYRKKAEDKEGVCFFTVFHNKQKNVLAQLAGTYLAQKKHDFALFTNGLTPQQKYFTDAIRLNYRDLGFLPWDDYFEWLSSAKLLLQVSVSEAFSYIAAESLAMGTPTLMSQVVADNMGVSEEKVIASDISSPVEISLLIRAILELDEKEYNKLCDNCISGIERTSEENNDKVKKTFMKLK